LAAFAALSVWLLALDVIQLGSHGGVWVGTDGVFLEDQTMYLAWIQDASHHLLISNLFVLGGTPHDFLQPAIAISAGLVKLGVKPWVALLVWQPVAVVAVFWAVRALISRLFAARVSRRAALVVALFGGSIATYIFPDLWLPYWSWGYPFALIGLACAIGALLAYPDGRLWMAGLLAGLASWLHPWMGELLLLILLGAEGITWASGGPRPRFGRLAVVLAGTALPLVYYAALGHFDHSWHLGERANLGGFPLATLGFMLAPLAVPALLAYRLRPKSFLDAAIRVWPPAAFLIFLLAEHHLGNSPLHVFLGISVPLAALAVQGIGALPRPSGISPRSVAVVASLAVLAVTVPVIISSMKDSKRDNGSSVQHALITHGEWRALGYLARDPRPGGVLAPWPTGVVVPGETGRHTYVGNMYWSLPDAHRRSRLAAELLGGRMRPERARAFVRATGARFLLADCGQRHRRYVTRELRPLIRAALRFGCATLYEVA
jgi:hypothetical protein